MIIPSNWNEIKPKEDGKILSLSLGGHVCKILDVRDNVNEKNGNVSMKVSVDIDEGSEFDGYFKRQYDSNILSEKKWPNGAVRYYSEKEEYFDKIKGFVTAVNNSNNTNIVVEPGKDLDYKQFIGKKIVGVFGIEEWQDDKGNIKTPTRLLQLRSLDKLSEIKIPKVKLIDGTSIDYEEYQSRKSNTTNASSGVREITDDELPF